MIKFSEQDRFAKLRKIISLLCGPYMALLVLFILCACSNDVFIKPENLLNICRQVSYSGIIALGMTFVIVAGGIDLSVGSLFAFCGVCAMLSIQHLTPAASWCGLSADTCGFLIAFLISIGAGLLGGMLNGAVVVFGKIPPFIVTLGTYSIFRSLALYLADSGTVSSENYNRVPVLAANTMLKNFGGLEIGGIYLPALLLVLLTLLLGVLLGMTPFGRHVCAVGANERVAKFTGIRVNTVRFSTYAIIGLCVGLSAILSAGRMGSVSSTNAGMFYELDAIAAVIIGGASMAGGRGTMRGTLAGILILGIVSNMLDLSEVSATLQGLVKGLVIIISVLIQKKG